MDAVSITWTPRRHPLAPAAVVARGAAAHRLAERLLARDDAALARLRGLAGPSFILVAGDAAELPWVDGAVYVGRDPAAPALLVPTALEPNVPLGLLERGVLARAGSAAPVAVLVDPPACIATASARPIDRARLSAFVRAAGAPGASAPPRPA